MEKQRKELAMSWYKMKDNSKKYNRDEGEYQRKNKVGSNIISRFRFEILLGQVWWQITNW